MIIHARPIGFSIAQFALLLYKPMPKTAPISTCVELIGKPIFVATRITIELASSALNPVEGSIFASLLPTVVITSLPKNQSPTTRETPKVAIAINGIGDSELIELVFSTSKIAANGPMAFAISFAPWLKAKLEAVKI